MPHRSVGVSAVVLAVLAVLAVLTITGCTSIGTVGHPIVARSPIEILVPSPGSSISARIVESSDTVLQARLLTLSDLPTGWHRSTGLGLGVDANCKAVSDPAYDLLPLRAEADFTAGSSLPRLTETLAYGDTSEVEAAWTGYVQTAATCSHLTMRLAGQPRQLILTQMPFPQTDDATDSRQAVATEGRAVSVSVCLVVIRKGNLLVAVTYAAWGPPTTSEVQHLVEEADATTAGIR